MANRLRIAVLALFGVVWFALNSQAEEVKITKISSSEHVGQWAAEEATGRIFASLPDADKVVEYDPATGQEVRKFSLAGGPLQLAIKSRWLVVACPNNSSVGLIDLKANKVEDGVKLDGQGPTCVFCSKADNPYAYAICNGDVGPRGTEIVQIDCGRQTVRNRSPNADAWLVRRAVMSPDGNWAVGNGRGISPSGADLLRVDEDAGTFQMVTHLHQSFGQIEADPSGRYWTLGEKLYPLNFSDEGGIVATRAAPLRSFGGSPVAIHPSRDLAVSFSAAADALIFQAFSDGSNGKQVNLQSGEVEAVAAAPPQTIDGRVPRAAPRTARGRGVGSRGAAGQSAGDRCLAFDLAHDRVVYGAGDTAYVLSIAGDLAARAKRIAIAGAPSLKVIMDQTRRVRLSLADGGEAKWKIESDPAFVKLDGNELVVSPTAADLGHYDMTVKATRDEATDSVSLALDVGIPARDFAFHIEHMALDPAGKAALVWGHKTTRRTGYDPNAAAEPAEFALVDLDELKVLAAQTVKVGVQLASLDDKYLYMALASGNVLYRLDRTDLSKRTRLFLNGQPTRIECLPGGRVGIKIATSAPFTSTVVYDRDTLSRSLKHFAETDSSFNPNESPFIAEPGMDGTLVFRDKIVDAATGELRCALEVNPLPPLADTAVKENFIPPGRTARTTLWARTLNGQTLASAQGSRIADFFGIAAISPFDPLAACIRQEQDNRRAKKVLEFHEIKAGEIIRSIDLGEIEPRQALGQEFYGGYGSLPLQFTKEKVVFPDGNRLYACPVPAAVKKKAAFPLALKVPKLPVASVENPVEVQFATYTDEDKPTYSLTKEYDGLTIDAARGKLTVDLPKIWKNYLANGTKPGNPFGGLPNPVVPPSDMRVNFRQLTGTELEQGKTAFRLPLRVAVSNSAGESDELRLSLIVLAPQAEVEKVVARQQADLAAAQAKAQEEMRRQEEMNRLNAIQRGVRMGQAAAPGSDAERITQLETRVRRLEASLDSALQKLDRLEKVRDDNEKRNRPPEQK